MFRSYILCCILGTSILLGGCSLKKSLPEGKYLYTGSKINIENKSDSIDYSVLRKDLNRIIESPKPNRKFLGMKLRLGWYNLWQNNKKKRADKKGFSKWMQKRFGETPVIFDERIRNKTETTLKYQVLNDGYFKARVESELNKKRRKVEVNYQVLPNEPYRINSIKYDISDSLISLLIDSIQEKSLLKVQDKYQLLQLKKEQERMATFLKGEGFFFFNENDLIFLADSTIGNRLIDLTLKLNDGLPSKTTKKQTIENIYIYPDYDSKISAKEEPKDTIVHNGKTYIYALLSLKTKELDHAVHIEVGDLYSPQKQSSLPKRLSSLNVYKFINTNYSSSPGSDSLLNLSVFLSPKKKQTVEGSAGLSLRSGVYLGPEMAFSYINRNVFRGAEYLEFSFFGNTNFPLREGFVSYQELESSLRLSKPGLLIPLRKNRWSENLIARSSLGLEYQLNLARIPLKGSEDFLAENDLDELLAELEADSSFAPSFSLNSIDLSFGYQWFKNPYLKHELDPIKMVFQLPRFEVDQLRDLFLIGGFTGNADAQVLLNIERMFIFQPEYRLQYDTRLKRIRAHNFAYRGAISVSGNKVLNDNPIVPIRFLQGQFIQLENDFRYYFQLYSKGMFASRFAVNTMLPLRSSAVPPIFDQYTLGGPYSIRAFPPRQIGPGRIEPAEQISFFTGKGDISLEGSLEYRQKLNKSLEVAVFADYGNLWLINDFFGRADGKFTASTFIKEIALGTGAGLRFDFEVILIRFDLAFPLSKPWLPEGERWVGDQIRFGDPVWRRENLTYNLAFGYPF